MPIYEYQCQECGHTFERIESFDAKRTRPCEKCHHPADRAVSKNSFRLKGTGWPGIDQGKLEGGGLN